METEKQTPLTTLSSVGRRGTQARPHWTGSEDPKAPSPPIPEGVIIMWSSVFEDSGSVDDNEARLRGILQTKNDIKRKRRRR